MTGVTNLIALLHSTAAYQAAAIQLMVGEANFCAAQIGLPDALPNSTSLLHVAEVAAPPMGVSGAVGTSNYIFGFNNGKLRSIRKLEWMKRIEPPVTNLFGLTSQQSMLNTNEASQLARKWLSGLSVDVTALERKSSGYVIQVSVSDPTDQFDREARKIPTPLFLIGWGRPAPMDFKNPVRVKLLGSTPELLDVDIGDPGLLTRPRLMLTNQAELVGALPPPRYFVEQLFGGRTAYDTVASPQRVEMYLLNDRLSEATLPEIREGPVNVRSGLVHSLSKILLDFETYQWGVKKACSPNHGVKARFARGDSAVEVRFCFECDILEIVTNEKSREENFDFNRNALVDIAKSVFPRDSTVRSLEKNKEERQDKERFYKGVIERRW